MSTFEELSGEMADWYGNLHENFQNGEKGQALEEAQSNLDDLYNRHSFPDDAAWRERIVVFLPHEESSRADRCSAAAARLRTLEEAIEPIIATMATDHAEYDDLVELKDACEDCINDAENIEFPGMFG